MKDKLAIAITCVVAALLLFSMGMIVGSMRLPADTVHAEAAPGFPKSERQARVDAMFDTAIAGFAPGADGRALAESMKAEYDALSRIDARCGTDEADRYMGDELPRLDRVLEAMRRSRG